MSDMATLSLPQTVLSGRGPGSVLGSAGKASGDYESLAHIVKEVCAS